MAFEDRCSPAGAPSPPGIPHSPQSNTQTDMLGHHHHHHQHHHHTQQQQQHHYQHHHQQSEMSLTHDRLSPIVIKQEFPDHHHQQFNHQNHHQPHQPTAVVAVADQPPPSIRFSITNILSENFGKPTSLTIRKRCEKKSSSSSGASLFRPYDISSVAAAVDHHNSAAVTQQKHIRQLDDMKLSQFRINHVDPVDFSRTSFPHSMMASPQDMAVAAAMAAQKAAHEQQSKLFAFQQQQQQQSYPSVKVNDDASNRGQYLTESGAIYAKIPPLGNLCKTVSQIGQSSAAAACHSPMLSSGSSSSSSSSSSSTSSSTNVTPVKNSEEPLKRPPQTKQSVSAVAATNNGSDQAAAGNRDSGMESSDDAKSETGSTKDDGTQLWPAWVYCTRYSDRPSSGKSIIFF